MEILGMLIFHLKKASSDFQFHSYHKKSCLLYIMYSRILNQVIALKFPNRRHYISGGMARQYLQSTRRTSEDTLGKSTIRDTYVLNILISDRLTEQCTRDIVKKSTDKNLDMAFNPKRTSEEEILRVILGALATKFRSWRNELYDGCKKKKVKPYGHVKDKIDALDCSQRR